MGKHKRRGGKEKPAKALDGKNRKLFVGKKKGEPHLPQKPKVHEQQEKKIVQQQDDAKSVFTRAFSSAFQSSKAANRAIQKPANRDMPLPSKGKKKNKKRRDRRKGQDGQNNHNRLETAGEKQAPSSSGPRPVAAKNDHQTNQKSASKLSALQQKMKARLEGARFRMLNEQMYTSPSQASFEEFQNNPELFDVYHAGFREQVEKWPVNPLDRVIAWVARRPRGEAVADFGCGEARLAASVPHTVHSFDLVAANERVTACDMANVPLGSNSVDVATFCLALMGENLADFIREAHRVLKMKGIMKIAEVRSRFEGEDHGLEDFIDIVERLGFQIQQKDQSNTMFVMLEFVKIKKKTDKSISYTAKPCIYKRR